MSASITYLESLAEQAHAEGGWGYFPGQPAHLEPTCLALLALSAEPERFADALAGGRRFLDMCLRADGAYRLPRGREEAVWPTALVLFTRAALGDSAAALKKSAKWLLAHRGRVPPNPEEGELHDINLKLVGWPWAQDNFSWVEPTAWACLALRRLGHGEHPRVQEGMRLLLDRARDEGGINYGNRQILGRMTEPIPTSTALMVLALQGQEHPRIAAAVQYLIRSVDTADIEHLCWIKLALDAHRHEPNVESALPQLDDSIRKASAGRDASWLPLSLPRQALIALALSGGAFRLPTAQLQIADCRLQVGNGHSSSANPQSEICNLKSSRNGWGHRLGSWFRGLAVKAAGKFRQPPAFSGVHIARAANYDGDLVAVLAQQYQHFRERVPLHGKRVVLKPNLVEYHRDKVINTDPRVVGAVIELCKREGAAEIVVAEGPGHWRNVEFLVQESGLGEVLRRHGVSFVDLNHDEPVKTPNMGRLTGLDYLYLSRTIASAEVLISLPKLKTHHWAGATLSLKNLFGTLPGICYGWPKNELHWRGIDNSIVDIALTRTPDLAIVDGIIGMEGDGPLNGTAKPLGALIMGHDLVAVDATCCRLMELDPEQIGYLVLGHAKKLGRLHAPEIPQLGEPIASLAQPFETVPHLRKLRRRSA